MARRSPSLFETTSQTVLHGVRSWDALVGRLQDVRLKDREWIQAVVLGSIRDIPAYFQSENAPSGIRHIESSESLSLFHYRRKSGRNAHEIIDGEFLLARTANATMYLIVFVSTPTFWRKAIQPLTDCLYPKASLPFLTQNELHELLKDIQSNVSPQKIRILEFWLCTRICRDPHFRLLSEEQ